MFFYFYSLQILNLNKRFNVLFNKIFNINWCKKLFLKIRLKFLFLLLITLLKYFDNNKKL